MEERNAQLERDVARYQERKRIEKEASLIKHLGAQGTYLCNAAQISILQVLIPVNEYHEAKERYTKAREHQRALHARVTKLKNRNAPAHTKLESVSFTLNIIGICPHVMFSQLAAQHKTLEKRREAKKTASKAKFQQMKAKWSDSERLVRLYSFKLQ